MTHDEMIRVKPAPMEIEMWIDAKGVPKALVDRHFETIPGWTKKTFIEKI